MAKVVHSDYAARKGLRWTRAFVRTVEPFEALKDLPQAAQDTVKAALDSGPSTLRVPRP